MPYYGNALDPVPESVSVWTWLFDEAGRRPGVPVAQGRAGIRDAATGARTTYGAVQAQATALATGLAAACGLQAQQTVAVVARNAVRYSVALFAAGRLGARLTALPPDARAADVAHYLQASRARVVFFDRSTAAEVARAWTGPPAARPYVLVSLDDDVEGGEGSSTLSQLVQRGQAAAEPVAAWTVPAGQSNKAICAFLAFSSGTTGRPKAVMISHHNIIAQLMQVTALVPPNPGPMLGILPYYHITGLVHLLHLPVVLDQELVILGQFDMSSMLAAVVRYRCEELWLVPPLLIRMVADEVVRRYPREFPFVRQFNTGAAPLPPQIIEKLAAAYPGVALRQAWGMTESCSCLTLTPPGLATYANAATVGKPVPGTELRVVRVGTGAGAEGEEAVEAAPGEEGELWARGPQITMGYLDDAAATRAAYTADGFLRTGDLGAVRAADGFVTIHDRIKELIKVRGHGVAPAELEDALLGHAAVADAAVVGVPHPYSGEVPRAFVVPAPGVAPSPATEAALHAHIEAAKPRYMRLAGGIAFVDAIPKSAAGKILRKVLRAQHQEKAKL